MVFSGPGSSTNHDVEKQSISPATSDSASAKNLPAPQTQPAAAPGPPGPAGLPPPPNGGTVAWLQVLGGFLAFFNSWGLVNTYGTYQEYYTTSLLSNETPSQISWIGALIGALTLFGGVMFAPLMDMGFIKYMALAGCVTQSFGMMMLSLCKEYWQVILAQGIVLGLGAAMLFLVGVGMVAPYFSTRRSLAIGMAASGSSLGGVIYPIAVRRLITEISFGWSARIIGFIVLGTGLISFAVCKRRVPPRKVVGLVDLESFKDIEMVIYCIGQTLGFFGFFVTMFYVQANAVHVAPNSNVPIYITSIFNAASTVGRVLPNFLADKFGPFNVLIPCLLVCGILDFCWIGVHNIGGMIVFSLLYGFFSGPIVSLPGAVVSKMTPNMGKLGVRLGFCFLFCTVGVLLGGPMAGIIVNLHGYLWMKVCSGIAMVASALAVFASRQIQSKGKLFVHV